MRRSELGPERILAACRRIELRGDRRGNAKLGRAPVRFSATKGDVLTIYIQKDSPGKDRESNWLPAPAGRFELTLRLYLPKSSVLDGRYVYPKVETAPQ